WARARADAEDPQVPEPQRRQAISLLGCFSRAREVLPALLDARQPQDIQIAALRALADDDSPEVAALLLKPCRQYAPHARAAPPAARPSRAPWTPAFLQAAAHGDASIAEVEPSRRAILLQHRNPEIARLAHSLFGGDATSSRKDVIAAYTPALTHPADRT